MSSGTVWHTSCRLSAVSGGKSAMPSDADCLFIYWIIDTGLIYLYCSYLKSKFGSLACQHQHSVKTFRPTFQTFPYIPHGNYQSALNTQSTNLSQPTKKRTNQRGFPFPTRSQTKESQRSDQIKSGSISRSYRIEHHRHIPIG